MKTGGTPVIWVGPEEGRDYRALRTAIRRRGLSIVSAPTAEDLPNIVKGYAHPLVVACDQRTKRRSAAVAAALRRSCRRVGLFVVVEQADFGSYYSLMAQGARCYYQLSEGPEAISQAVRWAATSSRS